MKHPRDQLTAKQCSIMLAMTSTLSSHICLSLSACVCIVTGSQAVLDVRIRLRKSEDLESQVSGGFYRASTVLKWAHVSCNPCLV